MDWHLLQYGYHNGMKKLITSLNKLYKTEPALHQKQFSPEGFEWINYSDHQNAVMSFIRKGNDSQDDLIVVCNFTPILRSDYRIGIPQKRNLIEIFNSDAKDFGGSDTLNSDPVLIDSIPYDGKEYSAALILPPLGITIFRFM